jgi:hypothetical protein
MLVCYLLHCYLIPVAITIVIHLFCYHYCATLLLMPVLVITILCNTTMILPLYYIAIVHSANYAIRAGFADNVWTRSFGIVPRLRCLSGWWCTRCWTLRCTLRFRFHCDCCSVAWCCDLILIPTIPVHCAVVTRLPVRYISR